MVPPVVSELLGYIRPASAMEGHNRLVTYAIMQTIWWFRGR